MDYALKFFIVLDPEYTAVVKIEIMENIKIEKIDSSWRLYYLQLLQVS